MKVVIGDEGQNRMPCKEVINLHWLQALNKYGL